MLTWYEEFATRKARPRPAEARMAVAAHPGMSSTEFARNTPAALRLPLTWLAPLITRTPAMGALPTLRAATDPAVLGGQYYGPADASRSWAIPGWSPPARSRTR
ncbi:hypothetical protein ABZ917_05165 [Nonomuraea wenchangensis]